MVRKPYVPLLRKWGVMNYRRFVSYGLRSMSSCDYWRRGTPRPPQPVARSTVGGGGWCTRTTRPPSQAAASWACSWARCSRTYDPCSQVHVAAAAAVRISCRRWGAYRKCLKSPLPALPLPLDGWIRGALNADHTVLDDASLQRRQQCRRPFYSSSQDVPQDDTGRARARLWVHTFLDLLLRFGRAARRGGGDEFLFVAVPLSPVVSV